MFKSLIILFTILVSFSSSAIESLDGFLVTSFDDRFKVVSPSKFKNKMEVIVENKTLVRLVGKLTINGSKNPQYVSVDTDKYQKFIVTLNKNDILHFVPLTPAFQEIELIVGNKVYEIPPKK